MDKGKILSLEERIPKIKEHRRRKANRRLIFLISLFFLLIVCVIYFQSPLSHVKQIQVHGNEAVTSEEAIKMSKLKRGLSIWEIDRKQAVKDLKSHPEIKSAAVRIGFPNTVHINVKEYAKIAFVSTGTEFFPILENGKILTDNPKMEIPGNAPILNGFEENHILEEMAKQLMELPPEIVNAISEIHYSPKKTDQYHISLYMNDGFEVSATILTFAEKMIHYPSFVSELDPQKKGIIDLEVGSFFKAYESDNKEEKEEGQ
ncbi:cell division protein FtsQ/DivIB [Siminovitchia sp. FSL H7-0308]|uniref:Cell division protein DivIB n=1 Tax=Siminovitchia thermophila TaxID=1245522 RepID=A0ABS2R8V7_9BACI|nr:cell division protein FtsQ/DivIB [Siminovitchia thermophila]MBM7715584.1 cell division protein FtsQ [Siminovitchia thermophila]ONK23319.1 cell division protein FtsQ [Bacillus sp. VT-16-64]